VVMDRGAADPAANGKRTIHNVTSNTFELYDAATGTTPIAPNGIYKSSPPAGSPGRWSYPLHPYIDSGGGAELTKVFYRVTGDDALGTFLRTFVSEALSGNSVDRNKRDGIQFRVGGLGVLDKGQIVLDADSPH